MAVIFHDDFTSASDGFINGRSADGLAWVAPDSFGTDPHVTSGRLNLYGAGLPVATVVIPHARFSPDATKLTVLIGGLDCSGGAFSKGLFRLASDPDWFSSSKWGVDKAGKEYGSPAYALLSTLGGGTTTDSPGDEFDAPVTLRYELDLASNDAELYVDDVLRAWGKGGAFASGVDLMFGLGSDYDIWLETITISDDGGAPAPPAFWTGHRGTREVR